MEIDIDIEVYKKLIEISIEKSVAFFSKLFKKENINLEPDLNKGLTLHMNKAATFSENISIFKLPDNRELLSNSIELEINRQNRLFKVSSDKKRSNEDDLIFYKRNTILLGDVGAGKTTTMKRLVKKNFKLFLRLKTMNSLIHFLL